MTYPPELEAAACPFRMSLEDRLRDADRVLASVLPEVARSAEASDDVTKRVNQAAQRFGINLRSLTVDKAPGESGGLRTVAIAVRADGSLPAVIGWLRPVILLPGSAMVGLSVVRGRLPGASAAG